MKRIKKNFIKNLWQLLAGYRKKILYIFFLLLILQIVSILPYYAIQKIIDGIVNLDNQPVAFSYFYPYFIIFIVVSLMIRGLFYIQNRYAERVEIQLEFSLLEQAVKKILSLPMQYHESHHTGSKMEKIQRGVSDVTRLIEMSTWQFLPSIFLFIAYTSYLFFVNWFLTLIFCFVAPIFIFLTYILSKKSFKIKTNVRRKKESLYGTLSESMYNIKTVKSFVQEKRHEKSISNQYGVIKKIYYKWINLFSYYDTSRGLVSACGEIVVVIIGTWMVFGGNLTAGTLVLFVSLTQKITNSMWNLTHAFDSVVDASVGVDRLMGLFDEQNVIVQKELATQHELLGALEFRKVNFSYEKETVIKNFSLKIFPGETVALVGPSGGGKTTITKLIYRYFDSETGTILIDNEDLKNLDLDYYRQQLGMVSQDIDIFNDTVRANISYGVPQASLKSIKEAARIANADKFIDKLKKKYQTIVGERGVKLSGGQRQRVGIARAIIKDPKILILDEATSFLDAESEQKIQQAIKRVIKNRTTIIIAHRLSTIKKADKIVFINNGKIIEQGSHEALMRKHGAYARMIQLQTSGYLE